MNNYSFLISNCSLLLEVMMKHGLFMVCAFVFLVTAGCSTGDDSGGQYDPGGQGNPGGSLYAETYWGEWIRMDADETWYISGGAIKINSWASSKSVSLTKQSDRVLEVTDGERKYYLYASRIANTSFTGKIAGFEGASASVMASASLSAAGDTSLSPIQRSVAGGKVWINVVVEDLDSGSTKEIQTDGEGEFTVDGTIPGDTYEVTPEGGTPVTVTPQGDGDDVGTITVTGGANFKTRITENAGPRIFTPTAPATILRWK
jgi:hypothetical protein